MHLLKFTNQDIDACTHKASRQRCQKLPAILPRPRQVADRHHFLFQANFDQSAHKSATEEDWISGNLKTSPNPIFPVSISIISSIEMGTKNAQQTSHTQPIGWPEVSQAINPKKQY